MPLRPIPTPRTHLETRLVVACVLAGLTLVAVVVVKILLPWMVLVGMLAAGFWLWRRYRTKHRALHLLFYEQLAARNGRISVLEFAMATQLTGKEARAFLDARAREFFANFEPTEAGDILYTFQMPGKTSVSHPASAPSLTVTHASGTRMMLLLTTSELARRLGSSESELALQRQQPSFQLWSRQRDPDGCGWAYDAEGNRYRPIPEDC